MTIHYNNEPHLSERVRVMVVTPRSTIFQLYRSCQFGGGNRNTQRKPPTCRKSLTHFMT
jgi:hypothetical protein